MVNAFKNISTSLPGVLILEPRVFGDERAEEPDWNGQEGEQNHAAIRAKIAGAVVRRGRSGHESGLITS